MPHSEIHGSKLIRSSPWLIAAYHVLHRLCMPRHSPDALKTLDRSHRPCPNLLASATRKRQRQTLRDLEHGRFTSRTPQTWIRRATGDHVLQRCPVASKAAKPCWRKTSFSRRTPTTLRSGTVDHGAKGFLSLGPPRDERSARTLRRQNPRPASRPAFRQGRGEDPSRSVFFFTMMIENRQSFGAKPRQAAKLVS